MEKNEFFFQRSETMTLLPLFVINEETSDKLIDYLFYDSYEDS